MMGEEKVSVVDVARPDPRGLDRRVGSTVVGGRWWVSTAFIGVGGIRFETMVFASDADGNVTDWGEVYCDRYVTREGAEDGHAEAVRLFVEKEASDG